MIIDISSKDYNSFDILHFPSGKKVIGLREVDSEKLVATIWNYDTEQLEEKKLNTFGIDLDKRRLLLEFI